MNPVTLIRNARHWQTGAPIDLGIERGMILDAVPRTADVTLDAQGAVLAPGLVDLHVHLREPGQGSRETIETGTRAAAAGGFTAVACMPNTEPVIDNIAWVEWVRARARAVGRCRVHPIAAVTVGQKGERLTEFLALKQAGAVALSDDGRPIVSAAVMRNALAYARHAGLPIVCHEEDLSLRGDGHMNEGATATRLGIRPIPSAAESVMVRRDVELAELTGGRVHLAHLSCASSFMALREAKLRGLAVTGETCPHYWMLGDDAVAERGTDAKMNPPLRAESDRLATLEAIADGTVDAIATDHAPHHSDEKSVEFSLAPFGVVGLETAVAICLDRLVHGGIIGLPRLVELLSLGPARILRLGKGTLAPGADADITVLDLERKFVVDPASFQSKSANTPFKAMTFRGAAVMTILAGRVLHDAR